MARVDEVHKSLFRRLASEMHYEENSYDRRLHVSGSLQQWNVGRNQQQNGNLCQNPTFEGIGFHKAREGACQSWVRPLERCRCYCKVEHDAIQTKSGKKSTSRKGSASTGTQNLDHFAKQTTSIEYLPSLPDQN